VKSDSSNLGNIFGVGAGRSGAGSLTASLFERPARNMVVQEIPLSMIDEFPDHPFKVLDNEDMDLLVESIKERGVITPITVTQKADGRFEIVSGHRRRRACQIAGLERIPAEVRTLTKDEAVILMVESNLQRTHILPSEKAFSYKMRLEAMKHQGQRTDLTSGPLGQKSESIDSRQELADSSTDSARQVSRYIRLTELIRELLDMVDDGKVAFRPAVEVSYIGKDMQRALLEVMEETETSPTLSQVARIRKAYDEGRLDKNVIYEIMSEGPSGTKGKLTFTRARLSEVIPKSVEPERYEEYIYDAIKYYSEHHKEVS